MLQGKLLSDFAFPAPMQMVQPPRAVPPSLLKDVKQVEFVGYVANPMYKRGQSPGEATKAVAPLRNLRIKPKQEVLDAIIASRARYSATHGTAAWKNSLSASAGSLHMFAWYSVLRMDVNKDGWSFAFCDNLP